MPPLKAFLLRGRRRGLPGDDDGQDSTGDPGLSVAIVAHNEADLLRDCLESVKAIATEILVVDAESDDATADVARQYTDRVIRAKNQLGVDAIKNIGLEAARCEWILILDPDERVSPPLAAEIARTVACDTSSSGFFIPRRNYELGKWIRTMGHYPGVQLRLVRRGRGRYSGQTLHQHLQMDGTIGVLENDLVHLPRPSIWDYSQKRNFYTEHIATQLYADGVGFSTFRMVLAPLAEFIKQYVVMLGWLDGVAGLIIAAHGGWGRFLTEAKLWQLWDASARPPAEDEIPTDGVPNKPKSAQQGHRVP